VNVDPVDIPKRSDNFRDHPVEQPPHVVPNDHREKRPQSDNNRAQHQRLNDEPPGGIRQLVADVADGHCLRMCIVRIFHEIFNFALIVKARQKTCQPAPGCFSPIQ
jgi:hypothetical protein